MVRIPLIGRQPKDDSPKVKDGKKTVSPEPQPKKGRPDQPPPAKGSKKRSAPVSPPDDKDQGVGAFVLGTDKKIPFPHRSRKNQPTPQQSAEAIEQAPGRWKLPEDDVMAPPAEPAAVEEAPLPELPPVEPGAEEKGDEPGAMLNPPEVLEPAPAQAESEIQINWPPKPVEPSRVAREADSKAEPVHNPPPSLSEVPSLTEGAGGEVDTPSRPDGAIDQRKEDALAILQAMPDYIFRIGPKGVSQVRGNGNPAGAGAVSGGTGIDESGDSKATVGEKGNTRPLEKIILEELPRHSEQHAKKTLETRQLQAFEFQVRDDKEVHDLEVRLTPLGESEILALVRDVTLLRQTHNALIESRNGLENHLKERNAELIRVNKMLKTEVELREEQEEILKKNFRKLEGLLDDTIGAITLIVERRDPHIAYHQRRVSQLACAMGQEMKLKSDEMRAIRMAAQLHDLGLIFVPAEIMRKPGKLTEAEMSVIKTHPDTDYQILKRIDFPISIADIVRQHHERMNGSGYPRGLKGNDISLQARILAVADVIEGMVFERPYRVAPGLEAALKEIADQKGTLYDAAVVDACLKLFAEKKFQFDLVSAQEHVVNGEPFGRALVYSGPVPDRRDL